MSATVIAFPRRAAGRGTVHVMPYDGGGFCGSHESSSGNSWGGLEGPFDDLSDAIAKAHRMAREEYGGCDVSIWPSVMNRGSAA